MSRQLPVILILSHTRVSMDSAHNSSVLSKTPNSFLFLNLIEISPFHEHDPDDYEVVPQSQLVISRQAFHAFH
ncbi:10003_t:CDS:2 [Funneliformis geosporum]|nr:10003_t:CDS:2 [Funneliformis geosporum]